MKRRLQIKLRRMKQSRSCVGGIYASLTDLVHRNRDRSTLAVQSPAGLTAARVIVLSNGLIVPQT